MEVQDALVADNESLQKLQISGPRLLEHKNVPPKTTLPDGSQTIIGGETVLFLFIHIYPYLPQRITN